MKNSYFLGLEWQKRNEIDVLKIPRKNGKKILYDIVNMPPEMITDVSSKYKIGKLYRSKFKWYYTDCKK